jgi:hypothetical protein
MSTTEPRTLLIGEATGFSTIAIKIASDEEENKTLMKIANETIKPSSEMIILEYDSSAPHGRKI